MDNDGQQMVSSQEQNSQEQLENLPEILGMSPYEVLQILEAQSLNQHNVQKGELSHDDVKKGIADVLNKKGKGKQGSLSSLTEKFIEFISQSQNKIISLDQLVIKLKAKKRRIYDIITIFEGVGMVEKAGKNFIKVNYLIDEKLDKYEAQIQTHNRTVQLMKKIKQSIKQNQQLDKQLDICLQSIKDLQFDEQGNRVGIIDFQLLRQISREMAANKSNEKMVFITSPKGTRMTVTQLICQQGGVITRIAFDTSESLDKDEGVRMFIASDDGDTLYQYIEGQFQQFQPTPSKQNQNKFGLKKEQDENGQQV